MRIKILNEDKLLCDNAILANNCFSRLVGLLGRKSFDNLDGMLLSPCSQIHSIGMKFEFDAIYLDKNLKIVSLYENVGKNKILPYNVNVKNVLELPAGAIKRNNLEIGNVLKICKE